MEYEGQHPQAETIKVPTATASTFAGDALDPMSTSADDAGMRTPTETDQDATAGALRAGSPATHDGGHPFNPDTPSALLVNGTAKMSIDDSEEDNEYTPIEHLPKRSSTTPDAIEAATSPVPKVETGISKLRATDSVFEDEATASTSKKGKNKHTGGVRKREPGKPVIIVLDSLHNAHNEMVRKLKEYLKAEAQDKCYVDIDEPGGINEKSLPGQNNFSDCGIYLVGYITKFLEDPTGFVARQAEGTLREDPDWIRLNPIVMRNNVRSIIRNEYRIQRAEGKSSEDLAAAFASRVHPPRLESAYKEFTEVPAEESKDGLPESNTGDQREPSEEPEHIKPVASAAQQVASNMSPRASSSVTLGGEQRALTQSPEIRPQQAKAPIPPEAVDELAADQPMPPSSTTTIDVFTQEQYNRLPFETPATPARQPQGIAQSARKAKKANSSPPEMDRRSYDHGRKATSEHERPGIIVLDDSQSQDATPAFQDSRPDNIAHPDSRSKATSLPPGPPARPPRPPPLLQVDEEQDAFAKGRLPFPPIANTSLKRHRSNTQSSSPHPEPIPLPFATQQPIDIDSEVPSKRKKRRLEMHKQKNRQSAERSPERPVTRGKDV